MAKERYPDLYWPPPLLFPHAAIRDAAPLLKRWIRKYKPDVILCEDVNIRGLLEEWGMSVPEDVALAHLALGPDTPEWSGMKIDGSFLGAACVDLLLSQIQHNQRGIPEHAYEMLLRSRWVRGTTTLPCKPPE